MALLRTIYCVSLLVQASLCVGAQNVFQVYHPVPTNENRSTGCNEGVFADGTCVFRELWEAICW